MLHMQAMGPPSTPADEVRRTLYGDALRGWGPSPGNVTNPGPLVLVYLRDVVTLTLVANDTGVPHNWFIDYNNNLIDDPGEPSSPDFQGNTTNFTFVPDRAGTFTYRCKYHPTTMTGTIEIRSARPRSFTLYGGAVDGWGENATNLTNPGPTLIVDATANVTLTLIGLDPLLHNWFIDYNNNSIDDPGEPSSPDFQGNMTSFTFAADRPGNFTYRCKYHPSTMTGLIVIRPTDGIPPDGGPAISLIQWMLYGTIAFLLVFAVVYHVRAVRAHRRLK